MKPLTFHFDPVSPYAYLAFESLAAGARGLQLRRRLPARAVRRPAPALGPERPGRDRTQARLDLPPCGLAGAPAGQRRSPCRRRTRSTRWPCCAWRWPARPPAGRRTGVSSKHCCTMSGAARGADPTDPARLDALTPALGAGARRGRSGREGGTARGDRRPRSPPACSACRRSRSTGACSGAWTRCRCWPPICAADPWYEGSSWDDAGAPRAGVQR